MSIATLKIELASRSGRDALPEFFPIDVLISVTREMAMDTGGAQSLRELGELRAALSDYLLKIIEMQGSGVLAYFLSRRKEVTEDLISELFEHLCAELVSKVIGFSVHLESLGDRVKRCLNVDTNGVPKPIEQAISQRDNDIDDSVGADR